MLYSAEPVDMCQYLHMHTQKVQAGTSSSVCSLLCMLNTQLQAQIALWLSRVEAEPWGRQLAVAARAGFARRPYLMYV